MTGKEATLEIIELNITIQTQNEIIEKLTRTATRLNFELLQLPGGMEVIQRVNAETLGDDDEDDDDDDDLPAKVFHIVHKSDSDSNDSNESESDSDD